MCVCVCVCVCGGGGGGGGGGQLKTVSEGGYTEVYYFPKYVHNWRRSFFTRIR